jgi:polyhydroxyalkanoate synthesis regulator phasin
MVALFGFEINRKKKQDEQEEDKTFALPQNDDGAVTIQSGAYYGTYVDLDGVVRNEIELITRYREMSMQPELETAIDEVVNESIVNDDSDTGVEIDTDELKQADKIKKAIREEFDVVLKLLNFGNMGHDIFRRWYVDGRLFYHIILDEKNPKNGIKELRYIDPRRIRKIREIQKTRDQRTGLELIKKMNEYYLYNERGVIGTHSNMGAKIAVDSIVNVNSGLMDSKRAMVLSYLHKAIKPLNQLRMVEDATVIYRLSRAPERRIFYIDVGNMPTIKAEQYLKDIMTKYRNKLVYDSSTGEIKDDRKHLSMLEDFWLPRREGGKGTEITTLPGGQNLGEMEDVKYFEKKLYRSLGVPVSRLEQQQGGGILGRSTEITRDELKFNKFIQRLRNKFSTLFDDLLRVQLVTKGICTEEEWKEFKEDIWYDFKKDNNFTELKEAELLQNRIQTLQLVDPYVGRYYSMEWVRKNILMMDDDEIQEMKAQIEEEQASLAPSMTTPPDMAGNPLPIQPNVAPPTPLQSMNAAKQDIAPPIEDGSTKLQENPLFDKRQMRFVNDSLEIVK